MTVPPNEVHLRLRSGEEVRLGVHDAHFVAPAERGPVLDLRAVVCTIGLADCHAHLGATSIGETTQPTSEVRANTEANLDAQLRGGVLLVADKGARDPVTLEALDRDPGTRPELHMAGRMIAAPGGYYEDFALEVTGPDLPEAVERACSTAASWVKLVGDWPRRGIGAIPNYAEDELRSAVEVAHRHGRRVAIHTAAPETPSMAVAAGVDSIEHGLFLTRSDLEALGARGGAWVPTIAAMGGLGRQLGEGSSGRALIRRGLANVSELIGAAPGLGVTVLAGTDLHLDHGLVALEIEALRAAGMAPMDAWEAGSSAAATYLGSERGIRIGCEADLVGFPQDPVSDLTVLRRPVIVMRRGRIVRFEGGSG